MNEEQVTVRTKVFGEIPIYRSEFIHFVSPIEGFETYTRFILLAIADAAGLFWLQSAERDDLAFVTAVPRLFKGDFELRVKDSESVYTSLNLASPSDLRCLVLVGFDASHKNLTMNLQTPVLINTANRKALIAQSAVNQESEYPLRFR